MRLARRIVGTVGIIAFVACCAALLLAGRQTFGWQLLSVPTGSMKPVFNPGSAVVVHHVPYQTLQAGDIITYTNPQTMRGTVTHRIIKVKQLAGGIPMFYTKGDANPNADATPVVAGLVQGRLVAHLPYVGTLLNAAKSWIGVSLFVYLPAIILMSDEIRRLAAYLRAQQPYKLWGSRVWPLVIHRTRQRLAWSSGISLIIVGVSAALAQPASALLVSNAVQTSPNIIKLSQASGPGQNTCSSNNAIQITHTANQTAQSGNANAAGNGAAGSASTGSATNNTSTNISISVANSC